jgi:membrane-associated PAP2 superfamily phosphatase
MLLTLALAATWLINLLKLDLLLAQWMFQLEGNHWALRQHWFFSEVLHQQGRTASILILVGVLSLAIVSQLHSILKPYRRTLLYLVIAPVCASGLVSLGKQTLGVDCPWSLEPFGGQLPYRPLLEQLFNPGNGACFPAGHASAGYAWLALYFACAHIKPQWRHAALAISLGSGVLFGFTQQLRGAHFLSHDIWSLTVCWCSCALLAAIMLPADSGYRKTEPIIEPQTSQ